MTYDLLLCPICGLNYLSGEDHHHTSDGSVEAQWKTRKKSGRPKKYFTDAQLKEAKKKRNAAYWRKKKGVKDGN